ncbi:MAG: zf-HC2 domain-containing protein, partial [Thermoanaerobaculia bacterium]|nr:zf-HC2 domain-containing protein [Thermoanaerobaculia bacterium]
MSAHPATELLSAYLDRELVARERLAVEAHIEECHRCQHRLEGLRRVVAHLQEVPTSRPPMTLAHSVETHVARALRERRLRPGRTLRGIALPHPAVGLGFALTVGLAIVLVLFTQLAPRGGDDRSRVILTPSSSAPGLPDGQAVIAGDRRFVLRGGVFVQGGLAAAAEEAAATLAPDAA